MQLYAPFTFTFITRSKSASLVVAAVFFILITIPLARFTDHLVAERERRERAQAF